MKPARVFALGMFTALMMVVIAVAAFGVGTAFAASSCFTDTSGHIYETAICWLKSNGIVGGTIFNPGGATTRATAAQWLYKQSQIPPTQGVILIDAGFNWEQFNPTIPLEKYYSAGRINMYKATTGSVDFAVQPSLPIALYGRSLKLLGVEFCYAATFQSFIDQVAIRTATNISGTNSVTTRLVDGTDRSDTSCRYYALTIPYTLTEHDSASFHITINWTSILSSFSIERTTFVLKPSAIKVYAPADSLDSVTLDETTGEEPLP
jgi:hypothetical protein